MISFKEYRKRKHILDEDAIKDYEEQNGKDSHLHQETGKYGNWNFEPQIHGPSQAKNRRPEFEDEDWGDLLTRSHEAINNPSKHIVPPGKQRKKVESGDALFYSLSKQQGMVLRVMHKNKDNPKLGGTTRLETILPKGKSFAKEGTQRIVIENISYELGENLILLE